MSTIQKLPSMEYTFHIHVTGNETRIVFDGTFTYHRPTLEQRAEISKMTVRLGGDLKNLPLEVEFYNQMCSTLYYTLTDAPDWWKNSDSGRKLYDSNIAQEVYSKVLEFEEKWTKEVWGEEYETKSKKSENNSSGKGSKD